VHGGHCVKGTRQSALSHAVVGQGALPVARDALFAKKPRQPLFVDLAARDRFVMSGYQKRRAVRKSY
jgi:hypothetical protein